MAVSDDAAEPPDHRTATAYATDDRLWFGDGEGEPGAAWIAIARADAVTVER